MNQQQQRVLRRLRSYGLVIPCLAAAALGGSACASKVSSGFPGGASGGVGTGPGGGSGSQPGGGTIVGNPGGGLGTVPTSSPVGDSEFDFDASLQPPTENPTKVAGKMYTDFPSAPVLDPAGAPAASSATLFGAAQGATTGGPCLIEPENNSLYPRNWMRPRIRWVAAAGQNLFEVRIHVGNQAHDLVAYTDQSSYTMDGAVWSVLHEDSYDEPITVTVRGGTLNGGALTGVAASATANASIAPVAAPGSIVYWTTTNNTALKGFRIGDETVETVLTPPQVQKPAGTTCVGCHTATPDGQFASFSILPGPWPNALANIQPGLQGQAAPWLGAGAAMFLASSAFGINTFSKAHWAMGDRIEVSMYQQASQLVWIDLEAATMANAFGVITRTGDAEEAGAPSWSHDGKTIAYVSLPNTQDGRLNNGPADIYTVPYNNRMGGNATPVMGANDPMANEYYPAFTPDDKYIVFSKTTGAAAMGSMYNNAGAEVDIVPAGGGMATRLVANDPPACTKQVSPGITNSWPKTAPEIGTATDSAHPAQRTYYWAIFSSRRDPLAMKMSPQLYVTAVVETGGVLSTYGALYLWNQPEVEANHTPAWENFQIPVIPHVGPR